MDPYEILQVDRRAHLDVIKAAYRVLARQHHPDAGGSSVQMAAINEAWSILGDPLRRARHDHSVRQARMRAAAAEAVRHANRPVERPTPVMRPDSEPAASAMPDWSAPAAARTSTSTTPPGAGTVLDFGRYVGWSISELGRHDPDYLLWLERTPAGRGLRNEIRVALDGPAPVAAAGSVGTAARPRRSWFR